MPHALKIPAMAALPALLVACADDDHNSVSPSTTFILPSVAPAMSAVDCNVTVGVNAFFCAVSDYCAYYQRCYPAYFSDYFSNLAECRTYSVDEIAPALGGLTITQGCITAFTALSDCYNNQPCGDLDYSRCEPQYDAMNTACAALILQIEARDEEPDDS